MTMCVIMMNFAVPSKSNANDDHIGFLQFCSIRPQGDDASAKDPSAQDLPIARFLPRLGTKVKRGITTWHEFACLIVGEAILHGCKLKANPRR
jgi:hypothetical protein